MDLSIPQGQKIHVELMNNSKSSRRNKGTANSGSDVLITPPPGVLSGFGLQKPPTTTSSTSIQQPSLFEHTQQSNVPTTNITNVPSSTTTQVTEEKKETTVQSKIIDFDDFDFGDFTGSQTSTITDSNDWSTFN
eukprot:TRINITY_DN3414_c0_g1_i2.p1 TRINITY_DN3414_c0_g1~~TRINITY_DN3414_c0_g1_i2.p1  ORF type:complete len:134 (-),score=25.95 TRINITY_DN3414_c0_g1_i2:17-418(-)